MSGNAFGFPLFRGRPSPVLVPILSVLGVWAAGRADEALSLATVLRNPAAFSGAHDIEIRDGIAFVAGKGGSLAVVDVRRPEASAVLWSVRDAEMYENAETVLPLSEGRWLVGTRDAFLFDTTDPRIPRVLGRVESRPVIDQVNGYARDGGLVFGASKTGHLFAIDVSNPGAVTLAGSRDLRTKDGLNSPHDVAIAGNYVVTVSPDGFGRTGQPGKLGLHRAADLGFVGKLEERRLAGANRVRARAGVAYVGSSLTQNSGRNDGLRSNVAVVDLADPSRPRLRGSVDFPGDRGPNGLELAGSVVFAAGGRTVQAIDVSNPDSPRELARLTSTDAFPGGEDDAHDLVYRDGWLFVTAQTTHALVVIRVGNDAIKRLAAKHP